MSNVKNILGFIRPNGIRLLAVFMLTLFIAFVGFSVANNAHAADANEVQCTVNNNGTDTDPFLIKPGTLVQEIIGKVQTKLFLTSEQMYANIIKAPDFGVSVFFAVTLFIMVYAILFATGMAQIKLYDFVMMLIKIAIIFMLFSPEAWVFFNTNVIRFFNEGSIELINYFTQTGNLAPAVTNVPVAGAAAQQITSATMAFSAIDSALSKIFSSKIFVILLASASSSDNYGILMAGLMALALWLFLMSLMTALWVYIMSLVMKTLLFGLAPIFIPTILFKRTRHLFDNWLNQIVSATLQPVLLFIFFIFFVKLMESSVDNILAHPACWTKLPTGWRGSPMDWYFWRFAEYKGGDAGWVPNPNNPKDGFPIPIIHILTFLILAELANRFNKVVLQIAMQISQASVSLVHEGGGHLFSSLTMAGKRNRGFSD